MLWAVGLWRCHKLSIWFPRMTSRTVISIRWLVVSTLFAWVACFDAPIAIAQADPVPIRQSERVELGFTQRALHRHRPYFSAKFYRCTKAAKDGSQAEACTYPEMRRLERWLDGFVKRRLARLSPADRVRFREEQRRWTRKRNSFCERYTDYMPERSFWPAFEEECLADLIIDRALKIRSLATPAGSR